MKDLRQYTNLELSVMVFNDEYFYNERLNRPFLMALIEEEFYFTKAQKKALINDLNNEES